MFFTGWTEFYKDSYTYTNTKARTDSLTYKLAHWLGVYQLLTIRHCACPQPLTTIHYAGTAGQTNEQAVINLSSIWPTFPRFISLWASLTFPSRRRPLEDESKSWLVFPSHTNGPVYNRYFKHETNLPLKYSHTDSPRKCSLRHLWICFSSCLFTDLYICSFLVVQVC